MAAITLRDPKELVVEHLAALRDYAGRVLVQGDSLSDTEEQDRAQRMHEFLSIGKSFKLNSREMAVLLYKGLLVPKLSCGCTTCRKRSKPAP